MSTPAKYGNMPSAAIDSSTPGPPGRSRDPLPDPLLEDEYHTARQIAHGDVDAFLERHREGAERK